MQRVPIRVEPYSSYLAARKVPASPAVRAGDFVPKDPPARIFLCVPRWPGPFDIEIDCVAVI